MNNNKIIVINGAATSGKDTFVKQCSMLNPKVMHTSMISKVKDIAIYCGWNGEKTENMRNARQPPLADAELTHFAEQRAAAHVQHEGRLALMPTTGVQGLHNAVALGLAR